MLVKGKLEASVCIKILNKVYTKVLIFKYIALVPF